MSKIGTRLNRAWRLYYDGFRGMSKWGKQVWLIIIIKLIIMFVVLKIFFFPNFLKTNYDTDEQRAEHVLDQITNTN